MSLPEGASAPLPEGTVTVLFTDLVGSTDLNQRLGDEAANAVERDVERLVLEQRNDGPPLGPPPSELLRGQIA